MSIQDLSLEEKRALLARMLRKKTGPDESKAPLSHGQRAVWFLYQLAPDASAYNIGEAMRIRGNLSRPALRAAIGKLVARHPALRTTFSLEDGAPVQTVRTSSEWVLHEDDLSSWSEAEIREYLSREIDRPFDLERGPVLRVGVYPVGPDEHVLLLVLHHIVGEFWALIILIRELVELYRAEIDGVEPLLPPLPLTYVDYVRMQERLLASEEGAALYDYWRREMDGELPVLELPTDRPRPPTKGYRGALHAFRLDPRLSAELIALARREGVTLYTLLLSIFFVHLHRHTSQDDLIIGTPMTGRSRAELAGIVGFFDNTLPVRVRVARDGSFLDVLADVHRRVLGAMEHQAYPFHLLVERLRPKRDPSRSPLFDVMFVLRKSQIPEVQRLAAQAMGGPGVEMSFGDLTGQPFALDRAVAQFDLTLSFAEVDGELHGSIEYSTDLFDQATVDRLATAYATLARGVVADPGRPLRALPVLSDAERRRVLVEWNDTAKSFVDGARLLHELFERRADETPDALAVIGPSARETYRSLDEKANRVAHALRAGGARPGQLVAVLMDKGVEQAIAVLGVLKAGAAYLPIDPHFPRERIELLLDVGEVAQVLVQPHLSGLPLDRRAAIVVDEASLAAHPTTRLPSAQRADDLAYVIFTSGSTGAPKGVMIDHRGAVNTVLDVNERFGVGPRDRVLAISSLGFDLSVWDVFGTLAAGGTLVVPDADRERDPTHLAEVVAREGVTIWNSVPALLGLVVDHEERRPSGALGGVRLAMLSGDWIPVPLPDRFRALARDASIVSMGGATEASIWSIAFPINAVDPSWRSIPYGRPMANQTFHVLDDDLEPCPVGVAGHLFIGGVGLARGYWKDAEKTSASFIEHDGLGRIYRTGDLGRYLPDGNIEFLGRRDTQVKIRGFRVELGEVEGALERHPAVRASVAVVREDTPGVRRLVGYVVPEAGARVDGAGVRAFVEQKLPHYMVPAAVVVLEALPLSSNGKVDRKALPAPEAGRPVATPYAPPTTEAEELLCGVVARVLGLPLVGVDDNLFELGADSVLAIQVVVRAGEEGLRVTPRMVFEHPTVQALARVAERATGGGARAQVAATPEARLAELRARHGEIDDVLPLAPMQRTMLLHARLDGTPGLYCEHVFCDVRGRIDAARVREAWQLLVDRHDALRAIFPWDDAAEPAQVVVRAAELPFEAVDLRSASIERRRAFYDALVSRDRARGFALDSAPLLRVTLVETGADEATLVVAHHHVLFDGWSLTILLREWQDIYEGLLEERPVSLEPARCFADFVRHLGVPDERAAAEHWRSAMAGFTGPTPLPIADRSEVGDQAFVHGEHELVLSAEETAQLARRARRAMLTPSTLVQGAWALLLHRWSGDDAVVFGVTSAGRPTDLAGVDRVVGLFITTFPVRVGCAPERPVSGWLSDIQHAVLAARDVEHVTMHQLQRWMGGARADGPFVPYHSIVVFENYPAEDDASRRATRLGQPRFTEITGAPLMLYAWPGERLALRLAFDRRRFDDATVERILAQLRHALSSLIAADERATIGELEALPDDERQRIVTFASAERGFGAPRPVHALFEEQARREPDRAAVGSTTYRRLDVEANALAHHLRALGVRRGARVALLLERSYEALLSMLAVLKAGAAYVPIEPRTPKERIAAVLRDAAPDAVITTDALAPSLPEHGAVTCVVDRLTLTPRAEAPSDGAGPDDAAYVIYTSGSTGAPKGVVVEHRSLFNYVAGAIEGYELCADDRVLQFASLAFDASAEEIFPTLACGAQLVLRDEAMLEGMERFVARCAEERVTVLDLPTAFFHELVASLEQGVALPPEVRLVIIGGERALRRRVVEFCRAAGDRVRLVNSYGPTEATIVATRGDAWDDGREVSIGRPVPNVRAWVLDRRGLACGIGVPGELHLGGACLARGYLGRPDLTAERFVTITAPDGREERVYRTGDLVRLRADGALEFLGRADRQVKIRGFRVELEEIEAHLVEHPAVRAAVVDTVDERAGTKAVVAWVVAEGVTVEELRVFLARRLPDYMVPSRFALLADLPRTASGKLDRRALPRDGGLLQERERVTRAPTTELEVTIAQAFAEVLGAPSVGLDDDFFALGGHSLLATRLLTRVRAAVGRDVPLRAIFERPTVSGLVAALGGDDGADARERTAMLDDVRLLDDLAAPAPTRPALDRVLLTGATGFLGAFLLAELLASTSARVRCLVRAADAAAGRRRIEQNLRAYGLDEAAVSERVDVVLGDLGAPRLGLGPIAWAHLAEETDVVVHNGALVNFLRPYSELRLPNVQGTADVLRLAADAGARVHHVSTLSVFPHGPGPYAEADVGADPVGLEGGYARSKWAAERLAAIARERGVPLAIHRPGRITGHSETGAWDPSDLLCALIKACVITRSFPDVDMAVDVTPVDYVSRAIVSLARDVDGGVYHLLNPVPARVRDLGEGIASLGYRVEPARVPQFLARIAAEVGDRADHELSPLLAVLPRWLDGGASGGRAPYACTRTVAALDARGVRCARADGRLLSTYVARLERVGFLPEPSGRVRAQWPVA